MNTKILVVDDNRLNVRLLTEILEDEGYIVYSADNGLVVLDIAHKIIPDIILLDIMMPGMDGFEVCGLLKKDYVLKAIPVIMVTAKTDGKDVKRALELGAFDYIKKPVDEGEVIARVQSALRFKEYEDRLKELALKDSLTGLYNHGLLMELLEKELIKQERKEYDICFAMIDIDYFKRINDMYGHMAGDEVLMQLSDIFTSSVRASDIVGRYGGEEFGIILPEVSREDAFQLCERLRENIENYRFQAGHEVVFITVSIGICFKRFKEIISSCEMVKKADDALYISKRSGRNRVEMIPDNKHSAF